MPISVEWQKFHWIIEENPRYISLFILNPQNRNKALKAIQAYLFKYSYDSLFISPS